MRAFLTGASGFVGGWLRRHLEEMGDEVGALDANVDLAVAGEIDGQLADFAPQVIYHLAALTHVGRSWQEPAETYRVNVLGTLELLEAARRLRQPPRVLLVSSAEVYGGGSGLPLDEGAPLRPVTPYAASKVAAEFAGLQAFLGRGLAVVRARPFNHVGPGQDESFVVSALAKRVIEAVRSGSYEVVVGNLEAARDFTDVRDVVRAYRLLAAKGVAGEVYNVCSGKARTIASVLGELVEIASTKIVTRLDESLIRPVDVPLVVGDGSALFRLTGWEPELSLHTTLSDVLADWQARSQTA